MTVLPDTKNHDRRIVPLPPEVVEVLQRRPVPLPRYFPEWDLFKLIRAMRETVDAAGLSAVTFHTLRHTFTSYVVMAGVDLHSLAQILGPRDLNMVQRYTHLASAHLQGATHKAASAIFAADMPRQVPHTESPIT